MLGVALICTGWIKAAPLFGTLWTQWLSFAVFWVIQMAIILRGMEMVRAFENWAAPFVLAVGVFLLVWMVYAAHGFGPILGQIGKVGRGAAFWPPFFPFLMGMMPFLSHLF